ncbi:MAG: hypothetical protein Q7U60_05130, partial [Candidatus Methanoperedens sp.]|nr:hypothetical protein [Candidatus Methanoperedens sp.]
MLSPPEFHFNGVTLTLPVINVSGNTSVGGKGTATVSVKKKAIVVQYPNTSCAGCANRTNPVNSSDAGKVYVNITSDYYDAWADYAESLGYTNVSTNSINTTSIELKVVPATLGGSTSITNPITFRGLDPSDDTPLENFSFRLRPSSPSCQLSSLGWQLTANSGSRWLVIHLWGDANKVKIEVGYKDTNLLGDNQESWEFNDTFPIIGSGCSMYSDIDLLNQSFLIDYKDVNIGSAVCGDIIDKTKVNETVAFSWLPDKTINKTTNKTQSIYNVTQHYFQLLSPDVQINKCSTAGGDPIGYGASTMLIGYNTTSALTYLHITENRADVGIS